MTSTREGTSTQPSASVLPTHAGPAGRRWVDASGAPVWPVHDERTREQLETLAQLFGATLASCPAEAASVAGPVADPDHGVVVGFGASNDTRDAAALYAHLTRRRVEFATSIEQLVAARPAVIVTTPELLEADLLEAVYAPTFIGPAPGLVWGRGREQLLHNVVVRAAAAYLRTAPSAEINLVNLQAPMGIGRRGHMTIAGNEASRADASAFLAGGKGVLSVLTHSDGVDAQVARDLVLCAIRSAPPSADPTRAPRCIATGLCHRRGNKPIERALADGDLLAADGISAPIFVFGTCFGVIPNGGVMDSTWGLADQFVASPRLGAVITSWEVAYVVPELIDALVRDLECGRTVGEAVARLNRSPVAVAKCFRMCLLGDPSIRLPRNPEATTFDVVPPSTSPPPAEVEAELRADLGAVAALRVFLGASHRRGPLAPVSLKRALRRAEAALAKHELSLARALDPRYADGSSAADVRRAVLNYLVVRGPYVYPFWEKVAVLEPASERALCISCGDPHHRRTSHIASFFADVVPPRRLSFCPRCVWVEDVPVGVELEFGWRRDRGFVLRGDVPPNTDWNAVLILREQDIERRYVHEWPTRPGGAPAESFRPPGDLPPGPVEAALVLMHGLTLSIVAQRALLVG